MGRRFDPQGLLQNEFFDFVTRNPHSNHGRARSNRIENCLDWLSNNKPGGHIESIGMYPVFTNLSQGQVPAPKGTADTNLLVAQKPVSK